jgi:hypothetical protein
LTIFIIYGLLSQLREVIVNKIKTADTKAGYEPTISMFTSCHSTSVLLLHLCETIFFLKSFSKTDTCNFFLLNLKFFPPCLSSDYILNQQGDNCKHYRRYTNLLLYCISEIFRYKYNFISRFLHFKRALDPFVRENSQSRSGKILLKNV